MRKVFVQPAKKHANHGQEEYFLRSCGLNIKLLKKNEAKQKGMPFSWSSQQLETICFYQIYIYKKYIRENYIKIQDENVSVSLRQSLALDRTEPASLTQCIIIICLLITAVVIALQ